MTIIKHIRLDRGVTPEDLALSAGISLAEYYDLEHHEDERHIAASVGSIAQIAERLGVKPSAFYQETSPRAIPLDELSEPISLDELARRISEHLKQTSQPLRELEEDVGWDLGAALETPTRFRDFPANGLRDVCEPVGINWLDVLDGLASGSTGAVES